MRRCRAWPAFLVAALVAPLCRAEDASAGAPSPGALGEDTLFGAAALRSLGGRHDVLVWRMRLDPAECTGAASSPCYNLYTINATSGELLWFAASTDVTGIRAAYLGHRTLYFSTWSGPGLYAVNLASGRVRWQFPLNNWFAYWRKEIDLPPSASFSSAGEGGAGAAFAAADGPPARLYGLRAKRGGDRSWEWKADDAGALLTAAAGPDFPVPPRGGGGGGGASRHPGGGAGVLYLALASRAANSTWLQAVSLADGAPLWRGGAEGGAAFSRAEVDGARVLAEAAGAGVLAAYDKASGRQLWRREGAFCGAPGPLAGIHYGGRRAGGAGLAGAAVDSGGGGAGRGAGGGVLLVAPRCNNLEGLSAVDSATGRVLWSGPAFPKGGAPSGPCSWVALEAGAAYAGCDCGAAPGEARPRARRRRRGAAGASGGGGGGGGDGQGADGARGVCMYAFDAASGKLRWHSTDDLAGAGGFAPGAQEWGHAPIVFGGGACGIEGGGAGGAGAGGGGSGGVVVFLTNETVLGLSAADGRLLWRTLLPDGAWLAPWQAPLAACSGGGGGHHTGGGGGGGGRELLLLHALRGANGNRTLVLALDPSTGRAEWQRGFNGTAPPPLSPARGGAAPLPLPGGGRAALETCRRGRCCLRALNISSGKPAWGLCLDAARGRDPTNPRAQFAIWVVTLVTVASVAALLLGAALLHVNRWADERALLAGGEGGGGGGSAYGGEDGGGGGGSGGPEEGAGAGAPRLSLFARAGGATATMLGAPPSPDSAAGLAAAEAAAAAALAARGGGAFAGRPRVLPGGRRVVGAGGRGGPGEPLLGGG